MFICYILYIMLIIYIYIKYYFSFVGLNLSGFAQTCHDCHCADQKKRSAAGGRKLCVMFSIKR